MPCKWYVCAPRWLLSSLFSLPSSHGQASVSSPFAPSVFAQSIPRKDGRLPYYFSHTPCSIYEAHLSLLCSSPSELGKREQRGMPLENCFPRLPRAAAKKAAGELRDKRKFSELSIHSEFAVPCTPRPSTSIPTSRKAAPAQTVAASMDEDSPVDDPRMCAAYTSDIYRHLRSMEVGSWIKIAAFFRLERMSFAFVDREVTADMRGILVDWLVQVAEEYKLLPNTLYLAVSYIDRFLSSKAISMQRLQLLGVSTMFVAAYVRMCFRHACYVNSIQHWGAQLEFLASYLAELSLVDYGCVQFLPSAIAASAVFCSGYEVSDLEDCIHAIHDLQSKRRAASLVGISENQRAEQRGTQEAMAVEENCPSPFIRAAAELPGEPSLKRKFSELSTISDATVVTCTPIPSKPRYKARKEEEGIREAASAQIAVSADGDSDPHTCATQASPMYRYLRSVEVGWFLEKDRGFFVGTLTAGMRAVLVDWLVQVAEGYRLVSGTLYLAVSYIDRFLSLNAIGRERLQLLGVSSMLVAAYVPSFMRELCELETELGCATGVFGELPRGVELDRLWLRSVLAVGDRCFSCVRCEVHTESKESSMGMKLEQCTEYRASDLKECIHGIHDLQSQRKAASLVAVSEKYKQSKKMIDTVETYRKM
ncbi:hypothetical protein B296_00032219 [Ensete ventricosum]|uniref:Cyclin N-terminal domain-containing protein n=1 Tax=Ensete ventricosum TaxID=4639 RepID=A0A426ZQB7_ENSVE|nr:hypothetical protein B296_00032219 [Ensete ventricosum]